ncbi:MAG: PorV/PorQ family protein [Candidatus Cloacimonas sp.]|nr:PorV/PorQ family protein [Candidatus Cloacimonadota bacterium]
MKRTFLIIGLALFCLILNADPILINADYGWKSLTLPPSTSISAMGGTGGEYFSEASTFLHHPTSGLIGGVNSATGSKTLWFADTNLNSIAISSNTGRNSFGFIFRSLDYGKIDSRDLNGEIIGEFHPLELNLGFNYARRLTPDFYGGLNLLFLYQRIESSTSIGFATDIGMTYLTPVQGLNVGVAIKHLGVTDKGDVERIKLPTTPELGITYVYPLTSVDLLLAADVLKHPDDSNIKGRLGLTARINDILDLRGGYLVNYDSQSITTGLGVSWRSIGFDYAYLPFKNNLDDVHSFSITYKF